MRHIATAAQHMPYRMARPHLRATLAPGHRLPHRQLAIETRFHIVRVVLHTRQAAAQQLERLYEISVARGVVIRRTQRLGGVIHRAQAGREPHPQGRVQRGRRVEDGDARHMQRMTKTLLDLLARVSATTLVLKFTTRQRGRYRNLPHLGSFKLRHGAAAIGLHARAELIDLIVLGDVVLQTQLRHLARVGDRAAAEGDNQVRTDRARLFRNLQYRLARRVRGHTVIHPRTAALQRITHFFNFVRGAIHGAADDHVHALSF